MHASTDIAVDLPKLSAKPASAFHIKLQAVLPGSAAGRPGGRGELGRRLVQRYRTELYEAQSAKCDNEFMEFSSGDNRNGCGQSLPKKSSLSFISSESGKDDSPPPRDCSVHFRRRRLPKLIASRANQQPASKVKQPASKVEQTQPTISSNAMGITFYPHKLSAQKIGRD